MLEKIKIKIIKYANTYKQNEYLNPFTKYIFNVNILIVKEMIK